MLRTQHKELRADSGRDDPVPEKKGEGGGHFSHRSGMTRSKAGHLLPREVNHTKGICEVVGE